MSVARVFALPPGVDFATELARGLRDRFAAGGPHALARVQVIVNTVRMQGQLRDALLRQGPGFLPRIDLITSLAPGSDTALRTQLILAQALRQFLRAQPDMGPTSAAFSLARSLAAVLDEMAGEEVTLSQVEALDVSQHSLHWERSLTLIRLIAQTLDGLEGSQAQLRRAVSALEAAWTAGAAPDHPVVLAGSTGSRGPAAALMRAVARLPQGAVVLPGFDWDMSPRQWAELDDPLQHSDHPQFRLAQLIAALDLRSDQVKRWTDAQPSVPTRGALVSLSLRPAPVTDQWLAEGPKLGDLTPATQGLSLIEAPDQRAEALAIALAMRDGVAQGLKTALITPDRTLARRVTVALDRWGIRPDDSAGRPLSLSAPGRLLRQIAGAMAQGVTSEGLIALLKHPLTHGGEGRGQHLLNARALDLFLRERVVPFPTPETVSNYAEKDPEQAEWAQWLADWLKDLPPPPEAPLTDWVTHLEAMAQRLSFGPAATGPLWEADAGRACRALIDSLLADAEFGGSLTGIEFLALFETQFLGQELREDVETDPRFAIWGTLEARAQSADLVVLGGLNDGIWPAAPSPDPWFNRQMRRDAGLLLPERQVGLSAHDYQQAIAAPRVILSRALRSADAETVPSRWLNRLCNLVQGLTDQNGPRAIEQMRARGQHWVRGARALDADTSTVDPAVARRNPRPAPAPGRHQRLSRLSVTEVETLIRDPYSLYARHILGLADLEPLSWGSDARLRGIIIHDVVDRYVRAHPPGSPADLPALMAIADEVLGQRCPWQALRLHWRAQLAEVAQSFVVWNATLDSQPVLVEKGGVLHLPQGIELRGRPDRIDRRPDGTLLILDYKTGAPPGKQEQRQFNKQLPLLGLMAEEGVFPGLDAGVVTQTGYVRLGNRFDVSLNELQTDELITHRDELNQLLASYADPAQGFTSLRAPKTERSLGPRGYHTLARLGEWELTDPAQRIEVGDHDG